MDWYSWLLRSSGLERSLVYEYSLLLSRNELEEEDIAHFDHEFLLSMGVAIAKHRLEILKLAKHHCRRHRPPRPVAGLLTIINKVCNCLTRYAHELVRHQSINAVAIAPRIGGGERRAVRRSRTLAMAKKRGLDVVCKGVKTVQLGRSSVLQSMSPMALLDSREKGHEEGYNWVGCSDTEKMKWDSMFQDLKPT